MRRLALVFSLLIAAHAFAADPMHVRDLTFLEGLWTTTVGDERWDEQWMAPSGGSVLGVARMIENDATSLYEILTVEQDATGPVLRMKHFNRGLIGWEEKDAPLTVPLARLTSSVAVFEKADGSLRLTYDRRSADELVATLERMKKGGMVKTEFRYRRVKTQR